MAIKKRTPVDQAKIEAFGAAAEAVSAEPVATTAAPATAAPAAARRTATGEWPANVPRTFLVRWPDPELARELAAVAALDDRTQHKTAIRALQRGLEVLRAEHGS